MTADEIRACEIMIDPSRGVINEAIGEATFEMLREIAAQLAELNERLSSGNIWANIKDRSFDDDRPVGVK